MECSGAAHTADISPSFSLPSAHSRNAEKEKRRIIESSGERSFLPQSFGIFFPTSSLLPYSVLPASLFLVSSERETLFSSDIETGRRSLSFLKGSECCTSLPQGGSRMGKRPCKNEEEGGLARSLSRSSRKKEEHTH